MSTETTRRMIAAYYQESEPTAFFSGMFTARPENFHESEEIEIDIVRSDEDVSVAIQDLSTGYRFNSEDLYTNKAFKPPIHKEAVPLNSFDLLKRMPGADPFKSPDFRANLITRMFAGMRKVERKIRRAIELQASQVMQTGIVTLRDYTGTALYTLDYKPKSSHFPASGVTWATATTAQKLADITSLAEQIRGDGLASVDTLIMGDAAYANLMADAGFVALFDARRIDRGTIAPMEMKGGGGIYRGVVEIGNYRYDIWTYAGRYADPQTGVSTPFMDPGKVIVKASSGRFDATFGAIPNIGALLGAGTRLLPELPSRMNSSANGMDLFTNVWISDDGEQLFGGVGARPLMVPVAIDTFGCLETQI